jgi:hypothetical protein
VKVIGGNDILEINDFEKKKKKNLSSKRLSNYRKLLILFPRWEVLLSESNEKRSVKTLPHVASRVTEHSEKSKNSYEKLKYFYKRGTCVEETIIFAPEIFTEA